MFLWCDKIVWKGLVDRCEFVKEDDQMMRYNMAFIVLFVMGAEGGNSTSRVLSYEEKLLLASKDKNADRVNALLEEKTGSDWKEKGKASVLHWAVHTGRKDIVKYVLDNLRGEGGQGGLLDYVWHKVKVSVLLTTLEHKDEVRSVSWSPDGSKICMGSGDETA